MWTMSAIAQPVTITFTSQDTVTVRVAKPIDGSYNSYYYEPIKLYPEYKEVYSFEMDDLGIVNLDYSTGTEYNLYVYPGAKLTVNQNNRRIDVTGDGSLGSKYINYEYSKYKRTFEKKLDELFEGYIQKKKSLNQLMDSVPRIDLKKIDDLLSKGQIISQIAYAIRKRCEYDECQAFVEKCKSLLSYEGREIHKNDSTLIYATIDSLYKNSPPEDSYTKYQADGLYHMYYYDYMYNRLTDIEKEKLFNGYSSDTFESLSKYLLAPSSIRISLFFNSFLFQYIYNANDFNRQKMLEYLSKEAPESESFSILYDVMSKYKQLNRPTVLIADTINTLREISKLEELKGHYVFIDLWASWCIACRMEFKYNAEFYALIESYPNLKILYLSIDDEEKDWLDVINAGMSGVHLRANEKLTKDIKNSIYEGGRMSIPRYVLLDPEGNIVNNNLSRPRRIEYLKKELDKALMR